MGTRDKERVDVLGCRGMGIGDDLLFTDVLLQNMCFCSY